MASQNRFTEFLHFEYQAQNVRTFAYHPGLSFQYIAIVNSYSTIVPGSILTTLARAAIPPAIHERLNDTPELPAGFLLWLATQGDKIDFLRGRYMAANWVRGD
jgi:hypothetical protein